MILKLFFVLGLGLYSSLSFSQEAEESKASEKVFTQKDFDKKLEERVILIKPGPATSKVSIASFPRKFHARAIFSATSRGLTFKTFASFIAELHW